MLFEVCFSDELCALVTFHTGGIFPIDTFGFEERLVMKPKKGCPIVCF